MERCPFFLPCVRLPASRSSFPGEERYASTPELAASRSIGAFSRVEYLRPSSSLSAIRKLGSFKTTSDVSVRYWWVNHSQTFRHEFEGGYIWSPKRKRDGSRNRFYDFLREVVPGDVVFSYADGAVRGAGFAISYCYPCPRPAEFGHIGEAWDIVGWRVDVRFQRFVAAVRPKNHLSVLRPLLVREAYSPLRDTGDGLQHVYLTTISTDLAEVLLGLAGARCGSLPQ